jgi:hypothetical protein
MKRRTFLKAAAGAAVASAFPVPALGVVDIADQTWTAVGDIKAFFDYSRGKTLGVPIIYRVWTGEIWLDLNSYVNDLPKERS